MSRRYYLLILGFLVSTSPLEATNVEETREIRQIISENEQLISVCRSQKNCVVSAQDIGSINFAIRRASNLRVDIASVNKTAKQDEDEELIERAQALEHLQDRLISQARELEHHKFNQDLQDLVKSVLKDEKNRKFAIELRKIVSCLGKNQNTVLKIKSTFATFFEDIFIYFWRKPKLSNEDCQLLENTYSAWASFYEDENEQSKNSVAGIPIYNANAHNASLNYWAKEQQNGRIPPEGLTILHADTHTDLGHVHTHHGGHWLGRVLDVSDLHKVSLLKGDSFKEKIKDQINAAPIDQRKKAELQRKLINTSDSQIRQELATQMRLAVHGVAQPLVGSQLTGVSNGNFIMCMPPWSLELPRSKVAGKNQAGDPVYQPLKMELMEVPYEKELVAKNMVDCKKKPGDWEVDCYDSGDSKNKKIADSQFQVVDCNNEERIELGKSKGTPYYKTQIKNQPLPDIGNFFSEEDKKKGFLLDIDLDVFVSEWREPGQKGAHRNPVSFERTNGPKSFHRVSEVPQELHAENSETDFGGVTTKEFSLIRERMDVFFNGLKEAKSRGYLPKVITIADSTALNRVIRSKKLNEDSDERFTPSCLVFLVNYMARKKLVETYSEPNGE